MSHRVAASVARPVVPPSIRYALRLESEHGLERAAVYLWRRRKLRDLRVCSARLREDDQRQQLVGRLVFGVRTVCRREVGQRWWKKCRTIEDLRAVVVPGLLAEVSK